MRSTRYSGTRRQPKAHRGGERRRKDSGQVLARGPVSDLRTSATDDGGGGAGTPSGPVASAGGAALGRRSGGARRGLHGKSSRQRMRGRRGEGVATPDAADAHAGDRRARPRRRKTGSLGNVQGGCGCHSIGVWLAVLIAAPLALLGSLHPRHSRRAASHVGTPVRDSHRCRTPRFADALVAKLMGADPDLGQGARVPSEVPGACVCTWRGMWRTRAAPAPVC